jgi:hypothetical protein
MRRIEDIGGGTCFDTKYQLCHTMGREWRGRRRRIRGGEDDILLANGERKGGQERMKRGHGYEVSGAGLAVSRRGRRGLALGAAEMAEHACKDGCS